MLGCGMTLVAALVVILAVTAFATRQPVRAPDKGVEADGTSPPRSALSSPAAEGNGASEGAGETIVVTQEELNRWLADHAEQLRPASEPRAEIDEQGIAVHVRIYGVRATYRAKPVVRDGRIVLEEARLEGPLGIGLGGGEVTQQLQALVDERFAAAGMRATGVELAPGRVTVRLEPVMP